MTFGQRIRHHRLQAGITAKTAATNAAVSQNTWGYWESGRRAPLLIRAGDIARALGVPVAALFTDDLVVAEIVVSPETVQAIRREGRGAAKAAAERLAAQLEPAIYDAATRKPADTRAGARPKPRKTRAERLADLNARTKRPPKRTIG